MSEKQLEEKDREIQDLKAKIASFDCNTPGIKRAKEEINLLKIRLMRREREKSLALKCVDLSIHMIQKLHTELSAARNEQYSLRMQLLQQHVEREKVERLSFMHNVRDREIPQNERESHTDRDRERERDRNIRGERNRQDPVFSRQFPSNMTHRFQNQQAEPGRLDHVSSGGSTIYSQPATSTSNSSVTPFDRWNLQSHSAASHFSASSETKTSPNQTSRRHADGETSWENDTEERPPSSDQTERREKYSKGRKDSHTPETYDRFRPLSHDSRLYDNSRGRKLSGSYCEVSQDYGRVGRDYDRNKDVDNERMRNTKQDLHRDENRERLSRESHTSDHKDDKLSHDKRSKMQEDEERDGQGKKQTEEAKPGSSRENTVDGTRRPAFCLVCGGVIVKTESKGVTAEEASGGKVTKAAEMAQKK